jgi:t-SNARE complex subunit (syntaxin)
METNTPEFIDLIRRMRQAQKDYFNTRNRADVRQAAMIAAKELEREADAALANDKNGQKNLFDATPARSKQAPYFQG